MTKQAERLALYEKLAARLRDADDYRAEARLYSGRAMYGKEVAALITDAPPVIVGMRWGEVIANESLEPTATRVPCEHDQMGLHSRVYI